MPIEILKTHIAVFLIIIENVPQNFSIKSTVQLILSVSCNNIKFFLICYHTLFFILIDHINIKSSNSIFVYLGGLMYFST